MEILVVFGFLTLIGAITGVLAKRKGYDFLPWFFAGGIIGLIALSFQPFANDPALSEMEQRYRSDLGNRLGFKLAVVNVVISLLRLMTS